MSESVLNGVAAAGASMAAYRVVVIEPMGVGGVCHYTYSLCEALASRGAHTALVTARNYELADFPRHFRLYPILKEWFVSDFDRPGPEDLPQPTWLRVLRRRIASAWTMVRIVVIALRERSSVIHMQWPIGPHDWIYLALLRLLGRKIVYTAHDVVPHEYTPGDVPRLRKLLKRVHWVILHAAENRTAFHKTFPDVALPASVVPMGNLLFFLQSTHGSPREARAALGIPLDAHVVLFFGAIRPYKGLADLIAAFAKVRENVPDAWLVIAGYPFEPFAPYEEAIAARNIGEHTIVRLGYHSTSEVWKFFLAADLVALPYRSASQSGIAQLAFAFGTPIVATRVGGLPELVEEGHTGVLVDPGDEEALATAIIRVLTDTELKVSVGIRTRSLAETRHSWDLVADLVLNVYDAVSRDGQSHAHDVEI